MGVDEEEVEVLTGISVSLRDQPKELIESRKAFEAMFALAPADRRERERERSRPRTGGNNRAAHHQGFDGRCDSLS